MALEHQVWVRLPDDLFQTVQELARDEDRTISNFIRRAIKQDVEKRSSPGFKKGGK
jgi:predicted transcriptional regulator